ncbi:HK97 family phage prohead protease [Aeromonas rivipollensis]|uniref:HK97 family phage prohead protease n=1 Tax=Aeromonas rivipollensis TaxID=948519 RepID=UPI0013D20C9F|nr:HK97 family phage prohead protease [Aeromonas rivipollensis]
MSLQYKSIDIDLDSFTLSETGEFSCYGSIFDVVDLANEVTTEQTFIESIEKFKSRQTMPIFLWNHQEDQIIGKWLEMTIDDTGLLLKGKFNLEIEESKNRYLQLKNNEVNSFSIGYYVHPDDITINGEVKTLNNVDLMEVSLVPFACNPAAMVIDVKNQSHKNENIQNIQKRKTSIDHFKAAFARSRK